MGMFYEPGEYVCQCLSQGISETNTGKDQFEFQIRVLQKVTRDFETGEETHEHCIQTLERTIFCVIVPDSEKAMKYLMMKIRHAGFLGDRFEDMNLEGELIRCKCEPNDYSGETQERWDLALPSRQAASFDKNKAKKLNALFGRQLKESKPAQSNEKTEPKQSNSSDNTSAPRETEPISNDEVPF